MDHWPGMAISPWFAMIQGQFQMNGPAPIQG